MDVAALLAYASRLPLPRAAEAYAAAGIPVFPCVPDAKRPLVAHGFHDACADAGQVSAWWRRWPGANIGVPTGERSGLEIIDVDRKSVGSGFGAFAAARAAGLVPGWLALVRTPSGGLHAYFPADPNRPQRSWQAARAHVDFRGAGGYVVVPPSTATVGALPARYRLVVHAQAHPAPVDASMLRDFLDPRPPRATSEISTGPVRGARREVDAHRLAEWVARRAEGERNRGLFWAACRLAEAGMNPSGMLAALGPAAEDVGLLPGEVCITIRSAYRTAASTPARAVPSANRDPAVQHLPWTGSRVLS